MIGLIGVWLNKQTGELFLKYYRSGIISWEIGATNQYDHELLDILVYDVKINQFTTWNNYRHNMTKLVEKQRRKWDRKRGIRERILTDIDSILKWILKI